MTKFWDTWPKYAKVNSSYGSEIIFIPDRDTLNEVMVTIALRWHNDGHFGEEDWFESDYEKLFEQRMGFTTGDFDIIRNIATKRNDTLLPLIERANDIKREAKDNKLHLEHLQFIVDLESGNVDMEKASNINKLYGILTYYEYNHEPKFSVNNFDKAD